MKTVDNTALEPVTEPAKAIKPWYNGSLSLEDAKSFIKTNLVTAARSFIAIGFYLKQVRDKKLFLQDGYLGIWDFAKAEYGLSTTYTSRYMSMNDRFSVDGNSPILQEQYRDFDKSKLQEMLYLEDEQLQQVTPEQTVKDIRGMRTYKEIPYIDIPGQMDFQSDFTEIFLVADLVSEISAIPAVIPAVQSPQSFTMSIADLITDSVATVATIDPPEPDPDAEDVHMSMMPQLPETPSKTAETIMGIIADVPESQVVIPVVEDESEPKTNQPELPILKNNDQRKAWVKDYKSWGMWYRDDNIDVNYYKYDFADGSRLIAAEYLQREAYWGDEVLDHVYYHLIQKNKKKYRTGKLYDEKFDYSSTCEGVIVEFLKQMQRKG